MSAVSRPPYLSALALWPKGDGWGGGGHFSKKERILLNHRASETELGPDSSIPPWLTVDQFGDRPGWGEDEPVWFARLRRDGWKLTSHPEKTKDDWGARVMVEYDPPIHWQKSHPLMPNAYTLQMSILGIKEVDGPWYLIEHSIIENDGNVKTIGRSEWADWSQTGDLLFSQSGCLFRLRCNGVVLGPIKASEQIADFSDLKFQTCEAPQEAHLWPSR